MNGYEGARRSTALLEEIGIDRPPAPRPNARTHIHWLLWAYERKSPNEQGGYLYHSNVPIDVIAPTYEEALKRAMEICPLAARYSTDARQLIHAGYDLMQVTEHLEGQCTNGHS